MAHQSVESCSTMVGHLGFFLLLIGGALCASSNYTIGGRKALVLSGKVTKRVANRMCHLKDMELITIQNDDENEESLAIARKEGFQDFWLDAFKYANEAESFYWETNGKNISFYPNVVDKSTESCLRSTDKSSKQPDPWWYATNCDKVSHVICLESQKSHDARICNDDRKALKDQLDTLNKTLLAAQEELKEKNKLIADLRKQLENNQDNVKLQKQIQDLKDKLSEAHKNQEKSNNHIAEINILVEKLKEDLKRANEEIRILKEQNEALQKENQKLQQQIDNAGKPCPEQASVEELQKQIDEKKTLQATLIVKAQARRKQLFVLGKRERYFKDKKEKLEKEIELLEEARKALESGNVQLFVEKATESINGLTAKKQEIVHQLQETQKRIADLTIKIAALKLKDVLYKGQLFLLEKLLKIAQGMDARTFLAALQIEMKVLTSSKETFETKLQEIDLEYSKLTVHQEGLGTSLSKFNGRLDELEKELKKAQANNFNPAMVPAIQMEIEKIKKSQQAAQIEFEKAQVKITTVETKKTTLTLETTEIQASIAFLSKLEGLASANQMNLVVIALLAEIHRVKKERASLQVQLQEAIASEREWKLRLANLEIQRVKFEKQISILQTQITAAQEGNTQAALAAIKLLIDGMVEEKKSLQHALEGVQIKMKDLESQLASLHVENSNIEKQIKDLYKRKAVAEKCLEDKPKTAS